jgi:hypothetical protein
MVAAKSTLPIEYLHECFSYDPETGDLTWKERPREHFQNSRGWKISNAAYGGKIAGTKCNRKHRSVGINGRLYRLHRVALAMVYGEWPNDQIDHINLDRTDNRITNLRLATNGENSCNRGAQSNNKCGYKGVSYQKAAGKYEAKVSRVYLGLFPTAELAYAACCEARESLHGEFVNHGG